MFYGDVDSAGGHCRSHLLTTIYGATNNAGMQVLKLMAAGRTCLPAPSKVRHNGERCSSRRTSLVCTVSFLMEQWAGDDLTIRKTVRWP